MRTSLLRNAYRFLLAVSLISLAVAGLGCGGPEEFASNTTTGNTTGKATITVTSTAGEEPPSEPGKYGGTLTSSVISDPKSFNIWISNETSTGSVVGPLYESLITLNPYTLQWEDALAELPQISADGLTWTFQLKPNLKWSDNAPLTADDVIFTYDVLYDPKVETFAREGLLLDVEDPKTQQVKRVPLKYRKLDERTVEFKFPIRWAPARYLLSQNIAPKHKLQAAYQAGKFNSFWGVNTPVSELVSSGPWIITEYRSGERVVYGRNPNYWKKDAQGRPLPYLDKRVLLIVRNITTQTIKFKAGDTDTLGIQPSDYPVIKKGEATGNYTVRSLGPSWGSEFLVFNMNPKARIDPNKAKLFAQQKFRQACSYAMNRDLMVKNIYRGFGQPQWSPESPANTVFYNPNVPKYPHDPNKAKALLNEIGLKDSDGDGFLEWNGKPVKFNILTNGSNDIRKALCVLLTRDFQNVGLKATFTPMDFNALVTRLTASYDWEAVVIGFTGSEEPHNSINMWRSSGPNHLWWPNQTKPVTPWEAEIDNLFREGAETLDQAKRKQIYDRWQVIVAEQLPLIYTVVSEQLSAVRNRFGNLKPNSLGGILWNIEEIYDLKATRDKP